MYCFFQLKSQLVLYIMKVVSPTIFFLFQVNFNIILNLWSHLRGLVRGVGELTGLCIMNKFILFYFLKNLNILD